MEEKLNSKYLIDEHPITFHSTLALAIGVNEAILLQKINLWLNCKPHNADGRSWIYNTYKSWSEQLPFWSESTIKRIIKNLFDMEILIKGNFNKSKFDKTVWYSIDYDKLDAIVAQKARNSRLGQIDPIVVSKWTNGECQVDTTYTNDYTMITNNDIIYSQNYSNEQLLTECNQVSNDTNSYKNKKEVSDDTLSIKSKKSNEEIKLEFEKLWKIYPRKQGKESAFNSYKKLIKNGEANFEIIEKGIVNYKKYIESNKIQTKYIKHGSTWFNQKAWEDEYAVEQKINKNLNEQIDNDIWNSLKTERVIRSEN